MKDRFRECKQAGRLGPYMSWAVLVLVRRLYISLIKYRILAIIRLHLAKVSEGTMFLDDIFLMNQSALIGNGMIAPAQVPSVAYANPPDVVHCSMLVQGCGQEM